MPRRREVPKREILPESKYGDVLLAKFMNCLMQRGKKSIAERVVYDALEELSRRTSEENPIVAFKKALENVKPSVEVKSRRVGGSTYQVLVEIRCDRRTAHGIRWIIIYARKRPEKTMALKFAGEMTDAVNNRGNAVKTREDTHKMAEANKAFAHYRW